MRGEGWNKGEIEKECWMSTLIECCSEVSRSKKNRLGSYSRMSISELAATRNTLVNLQLVWVVLQRARRPMRNHCDLATSRNSQRSSHHVFITFSSCAQDGSSNSCSKGGGGNGGQGVLNYPSGTPPSGYNSKNPWVSHCHPTSAALSKLLAWIRTTTIATLQNWTRRQWWQWSSRRRR